MVIKETDIKKQVEYYMSLPYTMTVKFRSEQGGYYVASYVELPYLTMTGDTPDRAVKELLTEKPEWFKECLKLGIHIPLPVKPQKYSGKIVLRIPPSMHESLINLSNLEGISLNQFMLAALSRTVGLEEAVKARTRKGSSKN